MSLRIRMTAKRQVTFPAAVCEALSVYAGDTLVLERAELRGKPVWVIEPQTASSHPWMGSLKRYAERKATHEMSEIRAAVARKRGGRA
jgi:bifunctional DNA-binding transcriptional regulator/antitoxin component of YhaV-PrlF toxin-antitoxin module